ncbi:kinase-like domain-containing protein [Microdochium trichocladiopsis]|uniref:Kinase-like domain-containing protein n=1 Tax=Microdochium trichocladiopsis TaxID=1682393 RepID=A0A9P9BH99_9PEZI|nr:kinase-like domain-containing protein [Microdochium trichocladiopsis]KAH7009419.1 kinase-like domain-containing protein [Microdochium trichocladiopsis]
MNHQSHTMSSNAEAIGAGLVTRRLIVLLIAARTSKVLHRLWKKHSGPVCFFDMCIKVKPVATLAEANAMRFVAQHTSIPVPKVYCAFVHKGNSYLVMSKLRGRMAWSGWQTRTEQSKAMILAQLRLMLAELRSVEPPAGTSVGGVGGGALYDARLPSQPLWGPFRTIREFHEALANGADLDREYAALPHDVHKLFDFYRRSGDQLVLTHGDLSSLNIMVEGDNVVGIVDWETAGWLPTYWEYTSAKYVNPTNEFWASEVDKFLEPMPHELEMERIRRKHFGAI